MDTPIPNRLNTISCRWDGEKYVSLADWRNRMLKVSVHDDDCEEGEDFLYEFPVSTPWSEIQTVVRLLHPTCTSALIEVEYE